MKINVRDEYIYEDGHIIKHCGDCMKTEAELLYALSQALIHRDSLNNAIFNMRKLVGLPLVEESGESHVTRSDSSMTDESDSA